MDFLFHINNILYLSAYIICSIPIGYIIAKIFAGVNIRENGSGSIGATNVLRVVGKKSPKLAKKLAGITLFLDAIKGMIFILIGKYIFDVDVYVLWGIGIFSIIGHCFSPFLIFEGGKGVATSFGVILIMLPIEAFIAIISWFIIGKLFKISSIASFVGLSAMLISSYIIHPLLPVVSSHSPLWFITIIILYKHIPNIVKLCNREEKIAI